MRPSHCTGSNPKSYDIVVSSKNTANDMRNNLINWRPSESVFTDQVSPRRIGSHGVNGFLVGSEGWVPTQHYRDEEAVALSKQMKEAALVEARSAEERAEIMGHWPWDDMDEGKYM